VKELDSEFCNVKFIENDKAVFLTNMIITFQKILMIIYVLWKFGQMNKHKR